MPIYEYVCEACAHRFEALQKFSDTQLTNCPDCNEDQLRKLVSAAAFRLKGGGWYETDFKSGDKKNVAAAESAPGSTTPVDSQQGSGASSDKDGSSGNDKSKSKENSGKKADKSSASS